MDFSRCTDFISALIGSLVLLFPHLSDDFKLLQVEATIAIIVDILATLANDKCLEIVIRTFKLSFCLIWRCDHWYPPFRCPNLLFKRRSLRKEPLKSKCYRPEWLFDAFWQPGQTSRDRLSGQESCQETNICQKYTGFFGKTEFEIHFAIYLSLFLVFLKEPLKSRFCRPEWHFDAFWRPGQPSRDRLSGWVKIGLWRGVRLSGQDQYFSLLSKIYEVF